MRKRKRNAEISIPLELSHTPKRPKPRCIPYFQPLKFGWRNPTRPEVKSEVQKQSSWLHRGKGGGLSDVGKKKKEKKIRMKSLLQVEVPKKITNRRVMSHKCFADSYFKEKINQNQLICDGNPSWLGHIEKKKIPYLHKKYRASSLARLTAMKRKTSRNQHSYLFQHTNRAVLSEMQGT